MGKWKKRMLGPAALVALVAVAAVAGYTATASGAGSTVIHLVGTEANSQFLNQGKGSGLGDEVVFSGTLQQPGGVSVIGQFGGTLTQITPAGLQQANLTLQLQEGQIVIQGVLDFAKPPYVHAITGGTGAYAGVGGEFTFTHESGNTLLMTLTLDQ